MSALKSNYPQIARDSGFKFRQFQNGPLDWRLIGGLEVDRILREQKFEHIDAILLHLSEAPLASILDTNVLDSGVAKYFTLSQLALQYMIFCRKFLDESATTLHHNLVELETQNLRLKTINQEHADNIVYLHKKLSQVEAINEVVFPCNLCTKNFVSNDALNIHLSKKHLKTQRIGMQDKNRDQTLISTIKLELEIKQLKERLNSAEKEIRCTSNVTKNEKKTSNSSTQINMETRNVATQICFDKITKDEYLNIKNVGTQCNLFESKELDCTEDESIYGLKKKDILFDIQEKVSKLEVLQKTYGSGYQQCTDELKYKLGEMTNFLETQTRNAAVAKDDISQSTSHQVLPSTTVMELHTMLSSIFHEVSQINKERTNRITTNIEKNYGNKLSTTEVEKEETLKLYQKKPTTQKKYGPIKKKLFSPNFNSNPSENSYTTSIDGRTVSCSSTSTQFEPQYSLLCTKEKTKYISKAFNKFQNKINFYGINNWCTKITVPEATNISEYLLEQRNFLNQVYPTFNQTRNSLNKLVELLISESYNLDTDKLKNFNINHNDNSISKQKNKTMRSEKSIAYKKRLEKMLRSPIKKPTRYPGTNDKQNKRVPLVRKHVMFHNENEK